MTIDEDTPVENTFVKTGIVQDSIEPVEVLDQPEEVVELHSAEWFKVTKSNVNPTHRDKVIRLEEEGQEDNTVQTKSYDAAGNTRVVAELQSDLQQSATSKQSITVAKLKEKFNSEQELSQEDIQTAEELGYNSDEQSLESFLGSFPEVPNTPIQRNWLRKGIEQELSDAVAEGKTSMRILISGEDLDRSEETQKWYETQVLDTTKKIAKSTKAGFEIVEEDGATYAVITPNKDFDSSTNTSSIAGAFVAYQAYQAGMSEEEVDAKLRADYDYDDEDMEELYSRVQVINQATEAGMELDEIRERMEGREVTADTESSEPAPLVDGSSDSSKSTPKNNAYSRLVDEDDVMTAEELVSALKVLHPTKVSDTLTTIPAWFGNQEARQRYDKARDASREKIIGIAQEKYDLDLLWAPEGVADEGWYVQTDEGMVEVTPGFMTDFKKTYGEMTGAVIGAGVAMFAGNMGPQALFPEEALTVPLAMAAGRIVGGGIIGAMFGSNLDYLYQAMDLQEAIEFEAMAARSLNAFEAAAVGEALGFTVAKGLGKGWKGIVEAKDYVIGGEPRRAYQSLKETTFLNDAQIEEIVAQFEKHTQLEGSRYEKGIQAVALSEYGMQGLVEAAGKTRTLAAPTVVNTITKRADDILNQTAKLTDEQVPRLLTHDLRNYTRDVKLNYEQVKAQATQSPFGKDFEWDFEELAITPVLEELLGKNKIVDPATKEKFLNQMSRINSMTESRSFGDLLELRQMTNDFLYNKKIVKADDRASIRGVIERIDEAIEYGAPHVLDDSEKWLADWATARADYSKMKRIQKTAMYNAIFKKDGTMRAVKPEQIVKSLGNHIRSIDGSFEEVMSILPPEGRKMYEGAVVDALTQQFTTGIEEGVKAIHFPMLADALKGVSLTTPEARATKEALIFMGETFKNDVWLSQVQGKINLDTFKSYLTADPAVRAKFAAASGMFNWISSKGPGAANRQKALVRATAKLLEKPLDAKNFKFLQAEVFDDVNLSKRILGLQQAAARDRAKQLDVGTPMMNLGDGGKINGPGVQSQMPAHRVLTIQQAREIAESEALTLDSKSLDAVLKQYGYLGILEGTDRVRILGD